jgi:hypothetical protein
LEGGRKTWEEVKRKSEKMKNAKSQEVEGEEEQEEEEAVKGEVN